MSAMPENPTILQSAKSCILAKHWRSKRELIRWYLDIYRLLAYFQEQSPKLVCISAISIVCTLQQKNRKLDYEHFNLFFIASCKLILT